MIQKLSQLQSMFMYCEHIKKFLKNDWQKKIAASNIPRLTKEQEIQCRQLWNNPRTSNKWIAFYNSFHTEFDPRMLPDNVYYSFIDPFLNKTKEAQAIDDKNFYDLYFARGGVKMPQTICRKIGGNLYDADYNSARIEDVDNFASECDGVIVKPSVNSEGGHGISIWRASDGSDALYGILNSMQNAVVQTLVRQHEVMSDLHKDSLNTIRLVTLLYKNELHHLSTIVRMGVGNSAVDNASSGGIFCGVNADGSLKNVAFNKNGKRFDIHPQGAIFAEHKIPNYQECISLVKKLAPRFARTSKLLSWDLAISEDGTPILIEVNLCYGELDFHQIANGPLFGDLTEEIVNEVFRVKTYRFLRHLF